MRALEHGLPRVWICRSGICENACDVLSDCMPFVSVHSAFALLQIHWIGWQVPVNDGVAIMVEIQPFLANGGSCQNERPKGRVKSRSDQVLSIDFLVFCFNVFTEARRESRT